MRTLLKALIPSVILSIMVNICWAETAVIVHPSNSSNLDADSISKIFLGKSKSFSNGDKAQPINLLEGSDGRIKFDEAIHGKSSSQIKSYWAKLVFTGKGTPPEEVGATAEAKKEVANNPSAISYIDASEVDSSIKVVYSF